MGGRESRGSGTLAGKVILLCQVMMRGLMNAMGYQGIG